MNEKFYGNSFDAANTGRGRSDDCGCEVETRAGCEGRGRSNDCGCEATNGANRVGRGGQHQDCGCNETRSRAGHGGPQGRTKLLRKIQEYNFMLIEAGLFLNNQPCCEAAQEAFCKYRDLYLEAMAEYEECYGPLTYNGIDSKRDGWSWINGPWPWEVEDC